MFLICGCFGEMNDDDDDDKREAANGKISLYNSRLDRDNKYSHQNLKEMARCRRTWRDWCL